MFKKMLSARGMGQVLSVFAALIVMIIVFALINPLSFSATNINNLIRLNRRLNSHYLITQIVRL